VDPARLSNARHRATARTRNADNTLDWRPSMGIKRSIVSTATSASRNAPN
jgi:hypothetical protein